MNAIVLMIVLGIFLILVERVAQGRDWPHVDGWWPRAVALNVVQASSVFVAGIVWDPWMKENRLWSADALGVVGGAIVGYLLITFIYYWWHRWRHEIPFLWRWLHQVHHSPQRIEIITSFYKHPFEIVVNGVLSSAILYLLVGIGPEAAALAVLLTGVAEFFYHWNINTPYWLGFVIQRPESHCIHHEEGLHSYNFADLPLWDLMFGTLRNPRQWSGRCGFGGEERELVAMLAGEDVSSAGSAEQ